MMVNSPSTSAFASIVPPNRWTSLTMRFSVSTNDIRSVAKPVLRHRVLLGFEGLSEGITTDQVIDDVLAKLPVPAEGAAVQGAR